MCHPRQGMVTDGHQRMATHGRAISQGGGTLTGAPRAPVGPAGPGGPASPWKRGGKPKKKGGQDCGEEVAVGARTHLSPVQYPVGGQPYLVTRSTSGAGGADGASQTSETVFARSAVSTFGTGVALGEEDDGGLPGEVPSRVVTPAFPLPFAQQHRRTPGSSSSLGSSSSSQTPGEELGSAPSKGLSPRGRAQMGTEVALSIPSPGGCCPPALA